MSTSEAATRVGGDSRLRVAHIHPYRRAWNILRAEAKYSTGRIYSASVLVTGAKMVTESKYRSGIPHFARDRRYRKVCEDVREVREVRLSLPTQPSFLAQASCLTRTSKIFTMGRLSKFLSLALLLVGAAQPMLAGKASPGCGQAITCLPAAMPGPVASARDDARSPEG